MGLGLIRGYLWLARRYFGVFPVGSLKGRDEITS
jgi:hypothetical protein